MNPFDFFEGIYCIVPQHKEFVFQCAKYQLKTVGILERSNIFNATENDLKYLHTESPEGVQRHLATSLAHLEIIKIAKEKGLKNVLIFEDDVKFLNNWQMNGLADAVKHLSDWSLFYLGYNFVENNGGITKISNNLVKVEKGSGINSVHAYAIHHSIYDYLLNEFDPYKILGSTTDEYYIDQWFPRHVDCHCLVPLMSVQDQNDKESIFIHNYIKNFHNTWN